MSGDTGRRRNVRLGDLPKLEAMNTGVKLPPGAERLPVGPCDRCDAPPRERCYVHIVALVDVLECQVCAECLADFAASGLCVVSVRDELGKWRLVGARPITT